MLELGLAVILVWAISFFWRDELHLMDDFRNLGTSVRSFSPVKLKQLVGTASPRVYNRSTVNMPLIKDWVTRSAAARDRMEPPSARESV